MYVYKYETSFINLCYTTKNGVLNAHHEHSLIFYNGTLLAFRIEDLLTKNIQKYS